MLFTSPLPRWQPRANPTSRPFPRIGVSGLLDILFLFCTSLLHLSTKPGGSAVTDCPKFSHSPLGPAQPQGQACHPSVLDCCVSFRTLSPAADRCFSAARVILLKQDSGPVTLLLVTLRWHLPCSGRAVPGPAWSCSLRTFCLSLSAG